MSEDKSDPKHQALTLRVPIEWWEVLREKAFRERTTMNDLIRDAIRETYGLRDPEAPEAGSKGGAVHLAL